MCTAPYDICENFVIMIYVIPCRVLVDETIKAEAYYLVIAFV